MQNDTNISKCGSYCHQCPAYIGNEGTEDDRKKGSLAWERYFGLHFKPEIIRCKGCQSDEPWKEGNLLPARTCAVRSCVQFNHVTTCAHCALFPCKEYLRRIPGKDLRERQEQARGIQFSDQEYRDNIEPFEGVPHLNELRKSLLPGDIKKPENIPAAKNVVAFPSQINMDKAKQPSMLKMYELMKSVVGQKAPTYIEQLLLNRSLPCALALVWSLSFYGLLEGERLVLKSQDCKDKKECNRFVRKTDNQLHNLVQGSVARLAEGGMIILFTPIKKEWQLTMEIDPEAGGIDTLKSLIHYVKSLAARYGEPTYVNSFNLKGKAFKLFSNLDMRGL